MAIYISGGTPLTWAAAREKVRGDLWRPGNGIPDDVVDRALHASLVELEGERRWLWLENISGGFELDADSDSIAVPPTVQSISSLSYRYGTSLERLALAPLATVREFSQHSPGLPTMYALSDGVVFFDTICPATLQFEMIFTSQTPEYVDDAVDAPNATLYRHQSAVIANACSDIAMTFLKNDGEAGRQRASYDKKLAAMYSREDQQRADLGGAGIQPDIDYAVAAFGYRG